jgi:two-component system, OmpR family, response regulator CpxR
MTSAVPDGAKRDLVLVVDDQEKVRDLLVHMLHQAGFDAVDAANGREALERLENGCTPAVILLDLLMPIMDGWELVERLEQTGRTTPVIVVSGVDEKTDPPPRGIVSFIKKPMGVDELTAAIRKARSHA